MVALVILFIDVDGNDADFCGKCGGNVIFCTPTHFAITLSVVFIFLSSVAVNFFLFSSPMFSSPLSSG